MILKKLSIICVCTIASSTLYAQTEQPFSLGTNSEFLKKIESELITKPRNQSNNSVIELITPQNSSLKAKVNFQEKNTEKGTHLEGEIVGENNGTFSLEIKESSIKGNILFPKDKKAYVYYSDKTRNAFIKEVDINTILCVDYHKHDNPEENDDHSTNNKSTSSAAVQNVNNLQSLPGAKGCLYLDFDGYYLPAGSRWNGGKPINAQPSGSSNSEIQEAWEVTSEDFRPFNVNVTTSESVFNSYPKNKRMRCVVTPTDTAAPGTGGVAYTFTFSENSDEICWAFITNNGKSIGEVSSHELGHTMGLRHATQGNTEYYAGHGQWAPIMGNSYNRKVTQWDKGEFNNAGNKEDDLAIMSGNRNGVGYRSNNNGYNFSTATPINLSTQVRSAIRYSTDLDMFSFNVNPNSNMSIRVKASPRHANLRLRATLYNKNQVKVAEKFGNPYNLSEEIVFNSTNVAGGKYYIEIKGTNDGNGSNGYTNYASIGAYSLIVNGTNSRAAAPEANDNKEEINVYPNPVKDILTINLGNKNVSYQVEILNSLEQQVYKTQSSEETLKISLSDKPVGNYIVVIKNTATGEQKSFKIIKR